jgi:predicted HTH transcriptional regulator
MISRKRVIEMIEAGEGLCVEFKQRFSSHEKIAKEMIAFANTRGGFIMFGVDDDKSLYGVESEKSDIELIKTTAEKYCEPAVEYDLQFIGIDGKDILITHIGESKTKPHRIQDYKSNLDLNDSLVYIRVNDKSILASKEMVKLLQSQMTGNILRQYEIGSNERIVFSHLDRNEKISVKELSKLANISERRASRTLIKLVRANLLLIHVKDNGESFFTYAG